jgi:hypothetical protein
MRVPRRSRKRLRSNCTARHPPRVLILVRWSGVRKPCTRSYRQVQALLKSDSLHEAQRNSEIRSTNMHRKVKVLVARWLASHIESRTRRLRRSARPSAQRTTPHPCRRSPRSRPATLRRMVLQREGADELQNGRAIAALIGCWEAGGQKRSLSLSARSTTF